MTEHRVIESAVPRILGICKTCGDELTTNDSVMGCHHPSDLYMRNRCSLRSNEFRRIMDGLDDERRQRLDAERSRKPLWQRLIDGGSELL
jgi:hypothetical protein